MKEDRGSSRWALALTLGSAGLTLGVACSSPSGLDDLPWDDFQHVPELADLEYAAVQPAKAYDLWEFRRFFVRLPDQVLGGGGTQSRGEIDPDLLAEFDAVHPRSGFGPGCLPGYCYQYVVSIRDGTIETWDAVPELVSFLGAVDSSEEALMLVSAHGYYWGIEKETGAIRAVAAGHEVVALRLVHGCTPVQTNRYLLRIAGDGDLAVLVSEVWQRDENHCI